MPKHDEKLFDKDLSIRSFAASFLRCGRKFTRDGALFPAGTFTETEVATLRAERELAVEVIEPASDGKKK